MLVWLTFPLECDIFLHLGEFWGTFKKKNQMFCRSSIPRFCRFVKVIKKNSAPTFSEDFWQEQQAVFILDFLLYGGCFGWQQDSNEKQREFHSLCLNKPDNDTQPEPMLSNHFSNCKNCCVTLLHSEHVCCQFGLRHSSTRTGMSQAGKIGKPALIQELLGQKSYKFPKLCHLSVRTCSPNKNLSAHPNI